MRSYKKPKTIPEYEDTFDTDDESPEKMIVKQNIGVIKGEIDGFFDTLYKAEYEGLREDLAEQSMNGCLDRIEEAREILAGLGVRLPNQNVNHETTSDYERLHELGRWVYSFYDEEYNWRERIQR